MVFDNPSSARSCGESQIIDLVSLEAEMHDPIPDLHTMFQLYDLQFFDGKLGGCVVEWSKRMKASAGLCIYQPATGMVTIRLSEPLLKFRPRRDFVETLLHEMIHAYLFVTEQCMEHSSHGPKFQAHMYRINRLANTRISIYHGFHAEVAHYRKNKKKKK